MSKELRSWPDYGLPVVFCLTIFCLINLVWNQYGWPFQAFFAYTIGGCLVSLAAMARALRDGAVTAVQLGLTSEGWKPQHRLLWLALISLAAYVAFTILTNLPTRPDFGDYWFWFLFLLPASLAEMLVFVSVGFCLPESWLRRRGLKAPVASILPALFSGVAFGLYHYTHEAHWHEFALIPMIPVMWINLAYFIPTRNFHLTLVLHNAIAAAGFTYVQYRTSPPDKWMNPQTYLDMPEFMPLMLVCFILPYLALHVVEWRPGGNVRKSM